MFPKLHFIFFFGPSKNYCSHSFLYYRRKSNLINFLDPMSSITYFKHIFRKITPSKKKKKKKLVNFSVFPIRKITDNHYKILPKNFLVLFFCLFFVVDWRINRYIGCNFFGDTRDHMEH